MSFDSLIGSYRDQTEPEPRQPECELCWDTGCMWVILDNAEPHVYRCYCEEAE